MSRFLFLLALALTVSYPAAAELPSSAPLFAATLADLDDKPVALEQFRGKPLIVNFWAQWCAPCRAEIPELIKVRNANKGKLEILGIGIEDKAAPAKEFARSYRMDYPVFVAKESGIPLMRALGNTRMGLPYTIVIDRSGKVVQTKAGLMRKEDLEAAASLALGGR